MTISPQRTTLLNSSDSLYPQRLSSVLQFYTTNPAHIPICQCSTITNTTNPAHIHICQCSTITNPAHIPICQCSTITNTTNPAHIPICQCSTITNPAHIPICQCSTITNNGEVVPKRTSTLQTDNKCAQNKHNTCIACISVLASQDSYSGIKSLIIHTVLYDEIHYRYRYSRV